MKRGPLAVLAIAICCNLLGWLPQPPAWCQDTAVRPTPKVTIIDPSDFQQPGGSWPAKAPPSSSPLSGEIGSVPFVLDDDGLDAVPIPSRPLKPETAAAPSHLHDPSPLGPSMGGVSELRADEPERSLTRTPPTNGAKTSAEIPAVYSATPVGQPVYPSTPFPPAGGTRNAAYVEGEEGASTAPGSPGITGPIALVAGEQIRRQKAASANNVQRSMIPPPSIKGSSRIDVSANQPGAPRHALDPASFQEEYELLAHLEPARLPTKGRDTCPAKDICPTKGCDCCQRTCTECYTGPVWNVGAEATFLSPDLNSGDLRYFIDDLTVTRRQSFVVDDLDSLFVAPRVWAGLQRQRWGIVARYWRLSDAHNGDNRVLTPPAGVESGYVAHNMIDAYTFDLEATRAFALHRTKFTAALGARYAEFESNQSILGFASVGDDLLTGSARSNRNARGAGLTAALGGRRPLYRDSNAHLFLNLRGSILWGSTNAGVGTSAVLVGLDGGAGSFNGVSVELNDNLFIGEVQVGMEWDYQLKRLPAQAFFRIAGEYQYWDAGQADALSISFADEVGVIESTAFADAGELRMDLVGFSIATGFTW